MTSISSVLESDVLTEGERKRREEIYYYSLAHYLVTRARQVRTEYTERDLINGYVFGLHLCAGLNVPEINQMLQAIYHPMKDDHPNHIFMLCVNKAVGDVYKEMTKKALELNIFGL